MVTRGAVGMMVMSDEGLVGIFKIKPKDTCMHVIQSMHDLLMLSPNRKK